MSDVLHKTAENKKPRGHLDPTGFDQNVQFHTYAPPADLAPFIEHFWTLSWQHQRTYLSEQVMHRPQVDVFISSSWSGIQGTFKGMRTYEAVGEGRIIGARFLPGAFHAFWPGNMTGLVDETQSIQNFLPEFSPDVIAAMMQQDDQQIIANISTILRQRLPEPDPNIAIIYDIITMSEKDMSLTVSDIAAHIGKSERWVQDLFQTYVGVGLKWLLQRNRLLHAATHIRSAQQPDWAAIAYDAGYSSQQHFITDFKKVTSKTPLQYWKGVSST